MDTLSQIAPGSKARIMVVEDEGLVARDIRQILEDLGYTVTGMAGSGAEALALADSAAADLVLMDIKIRGDMDGIEVADRLRLRFNVPVVFLTEHTDSPTLDRAKVTEPFGYLVKPFSSGDIKASIEITLQRHRLQKQIDEKEAWLTAVLRSIGNAMIVTNAKGEITYFNPMAEELLGMKSAAICGRKLDSVLKIQAEDAELLERNITSDPAQGVHFTTGSLLRPDGRECLVISSFSAIRGQEEGERYGTVIVLRDISSVEKTEQALRETNLFLSKSNDQLSQLAYTLSHDLCEPLSNITMASELLSDDCQNSLTGAAQRCLGLIQNSCGRMAGILYSLLDYYRISNSSAQEAVLVDLASIVRDVLINLESSIKGSGAVVAAEGLPMVYSHPVALWQILQNLISNAIKYAGSAVPQVVISAQRSGESWIISVADSGLGFDPSQTEAVFELFKRAHGPEIAGSGIGLATCRRLVEQYGGHIWAETEMGKGSKFHFTVPAPPR